MPPFLPLYFCNVETHAVHGPSMIHIDSSLLGCHCTGDYMYATFAYVYTRCMGLAGCMAIGACLATQDWFIWEFRYFLLISHWCYPVLPSDHCSCILKRSRLVYKVHPLSDILLPDITIENLSHKG